MAVTPVGLNQQVYMGQQNGTVQTAPQNVPTNQPIPVGQPYSTGQQVPQGQQVQYPQGNGAYPVYYPYNNGMNNLPQSQNTYDADIMMTGIDFEQAAKDAGLISPDAQVQVQQQVDQQQVPAQNAQQQVVQQNVNPQQVPAFTGNPFVQGQQANDNLTNCLVTPEATAKDGAEKKFKLGPAIGTAVGFAAPFVCNKARLGKFLTKDLLIKAPVISAGGLCAGGIVEGLVASAKKLDANNNAEADVKAPAKMDEKA
ncbi:hypothetical protein J6A34_02830 [bacterium]|nr:hypothetical protein [bacterium]